MSEKSKIIYDGTCKLCNQAVRLLKSGEGESGMAFFQAENQDTQALLQQHHIPGELTNKTVILLDDRKLYIKSSAIIKALQTKGGWWKLAGLLKIIPRIIRDTVYDFIARNR